MLWRMVASWSSRAGSARGVTVATQLLSLTFKMKAKWIFEIMGTIYLWQYSITSQKTYIFRHLDNFSVKLLLWIELIKFLLKWETFSLFSYLWHMTIYSLSSKVSTEKTHIYIYIYIYIYMKSHSKPNEYVSRKRLLSAGSNNKETNKQQQQKQKTIHTEKSNKMQQCINIYYSIFIWNSTCFRRHTAHHQEPKTALAASCFTYVEGCWTCGCWPLSAASNHMSNNLPRMQNKRLLVQF